METVKAVEMVRKIRDKQYEETKGMSNEELKLYFHRGPSQQMRKYQIVNRRKQRVFTDQGDPLLLSDFRYKTYK